LVDDRAESFLAFLEAAGRLLRLGSPEVLGRLLPAPRMRFDGIGNLISDGFSALNTEMAVSESRGRKIRQDGGRPDGCRKTTGFWLNPF
jgi:hypothetical protein